MQIQLALKEKEVTLVIQDGEELIDEIGWIDENDLLEKFFPGIDGMLASNNIDIDDVDDFVFKTDIPTGYTTARIARTIIKTLNFAHK